MVCNNYGRQFYILFGKKMFDKIFFFFTINYYCWLTRRSVALLLCGLSMFYFRFVCNQQPFVICKPGPSAIDSRNDGQSCLIHIVLKLPSFPRNVNCLNVSCFIIVIKKLFFHTVLCMYVLC